MTLTPVADRCLSLRVSGARFRPTGAGLWVHRSNGPADEAWDAFVAEAEDGHFTQTAAWASFKAMKGWRVARVAIGHADVTLAGAQMLIRPLPLVGAIGYVCPRARSPPDAAATS